MNLLQYIIQNNIKLSDWARYVAIDYDGGIYEYRDRPICRSNTWNSSKGDINHIGTWLAYHYNFDWRDSLMEIILPDFRGDFLRAFKDGPYDFTSKKDAIRAMLDGHVVLANDKKYWWSEDADVFVYESKHTGTTAIMCFSLFGNWKIFKEKKVLWFSVLYDPTTKATFTNSVWLPEGEEPADDEHLFWCKSNITEEE